MPVATPQCCSPNLFPLVPCPLFSYPFSHSRRKKAKVPKPDAYLRTIKDKKLKGRLRHTERMFSQSAKQAAKINDWLLPAEGGYLEAEGATVGTWTACHFNDGICISQRMMESCSLSRKLIIKEGW